jgi:hypothetical protein
MRDGRGKLVPERLEAIFTTRKQLQKINKDLEGLQRLLRYLAEEPGAQGMDHMRVAQLMSDLRNEIRFGAPFGVCDCRAWADCEKCGGKRWFSGKEHIRGKQLASA